MNTYDEAILTRRFASKDATIARLRAINAQLLAACRRALPWCEHVAATAQAVTADLAAEAAKACRAAIEATEKGTEQ